MTKTTPHIAIAFQRLTEVPLDEIVAHMSDPRVTEHMPLSRAPWDRSRCAELVAAKETCWARDGLGHWAFFCGGTYAGWGGFQKEGDEWDYGLVLKRDYFGFGPRITRRALAFARGDPRIPFVTFLLPPSRTRLKGLARLGASQVGETLYAGNRFLKYRLDTA